MEMLFSLTYGYEGLNNPWRMILIVLYLAIGLVLIIKGGDWFVDSASWIAEKFKIPKLIIGATIVSFATTLPEFLVSVFAAIEGVQGVAGSEGAIDMATGNAIGSVIANTGLIMSLSILFMPVKVNRKTFIIKPLILIFSVALLLIFSIDQKLYWWESIFMILILIGFLVDNVLEAKSQMKKEAALATNRGPNPTPVSPSSSLEKKEEIKEEGVKSEEKPEKVTKDWVHIVFFILGVIGIVAGAQLLVDNATAFATEIGVPDKIIAITVVAIGTSLPELITTVTAIVKKQSDLSVGNVLGANIIDMCLILAVCSFIYGSYLPVHLSTLYLDLPFALGIIGFATIPTMINQKLSRWQGCVTLALYATYLVLSCTLTF